MDEALELFRRKFADCFQQSDPAVFTPDLEFRTLEEWGSMLALIVIAMIDSDYSVSVDSQELKKANTIKELFVVVQSKLNQTA